MEVFLPNEREESCLVATLMFVVLDLCCGKSLEAVLPGKDCVTVKIYGENRFISTFLRKKFVRWGHLFRYYVSYYVAKKSRKVHRPRGLDSECAA
jgi:hypothetical protein